MSIDRQRLRRFDRTMGARVRSAANYPIAATLSVVPAPLKTRAIIAEARQSVVRHVNNTMTLAYWLIGRRLVVEEQRGVRRAAYGEHLLERVSRELTTEFGQGFAEPQLRNCRLFYQAYPTESAIRYALRIKLSWTHHRAIMRIGDPKAREYYLREAADRNLSARQIERGCWADTRNRSAADYSISATLSVVPDPLSLLCRSVKTAKGEK